MIKRFLADLGFIAPDFLTHTPKLTKIGRIHKGKEVWHSRELTPTALINGGRSRCWAVYLKAKQKEDESQ